MWCFVFHYCYLNLTLAIRIFTRWGLAVWFLMVGVRRQFDNVICIHKKGNKSLTNDFWLNRICNLGRSENNKRSFFYKAFTHYANNIISEMIQPRGNPPTPSRFLNVRTPKSYFFRPGKSALYFQARFHVIIMMMEYSLMQMHIGNLISVFLFL